MVVPEVSHWEDAGQRWNLTWSRQLSDEDQSKADIMQAILLEVQLTKDSGVGWFWGCDRFKLFTVKSCYQHIISISQVTLHDAFFVENFDGVVKGSGSN